MIRIEELTKCIQIKVDTHKGTLCDLSIILLLGLLSVTWFREGLSIKAGDSFFGLSPSYDLMHWSYVWDHITSTGIPSPRSLVGLPYFLSMAFLERIGFSLVTSQEILFYLLFTLSGLSAYYLSSVLVGKDRRRVAGLASAFFYMMNPFTLTNVWGTHIITIVFAYPIAPLLLALFIKGLSGGEKYFRCLFLNLSIWFAFSYSSANPAFVVPIWLMQFSYLAFYIILKRKSKSDIVSALRFAFLLVTLWLFLNMWWILPSIPFVHEQLIAAELSGTPLDIFLGGSEYTSILNSLRLLGMWTLYVQHFPDPYFTWSALYSTIPFVIMSFLIPVMSFLALLLRPKSKNVLFFSILAVCGLFLIKGAAFPFGEVNLWLFINIPFAGIFRAHYEKLGVIVAVSYAFLIGISISELYQRIKSTSFIRKNAFKHVPALSMLLLLTLTYAVYIFPFWTGDVIFPGGQVLAASRIRIPEYYYDAGSWINRQQDEFSIFALPPASNIGTVRYLWNYGYGGSDPLIEYFFHDRSLIAVVQTGYPPADDLPMRLATSFLDEDPPKSAGKVVGLMNAKYILLQRDFNPYFTPISLGQFEKVLENLKGFYLEKTFEKLDFYRNEYWRPTQIYATSDAILVHGSLDNMIRVVERNDFLLGESVLFLSDQNGAQQLSDIYTQMIEFKSININLTMYDGEANPVNWTSIATEPYVARHYAGWKGVISTNGYGDPDMLIFSSLNDCPYAFPPQSPNGWSAYNSTLVYLITDDKPRKIYSIVADEKPATDVVGVWWETDWMGISTKPVTYPIEIPPYQRAIIQINHKADNVALLIEPPDFKIPLATNKPDISYQKINPTKYIVQVNASRPFFLVFSESYHKDWIAYVDGQQISNEYHFVANGYANAWYINKTSTHTITLEFWPQKLFYIGSTISITTLILCILYISRNKIKTLYKRYTKKRKDKARAGAFIVLPAVILHVRSKKD